RDAPLPAEAPRARGPLRGDRTGRGRCRPRLVPEPRGDPGPRAGRHPRLLGAPARLRLLAAPARRRLEARARCGPRLARVSRPSSSRSRLENIALVLLGVLFLGALAGLGPSGFTDVVRRVYMGTLSQHAPRFGERLSGETRALYLLLAAAGLAAIGVGLVAARRRTGALALVVGSDPGPRGMALAAVLACGTLFVGVRAARDVLRARDLAGLGFEARRARLHAENPFEPDPDAVRRFRAALDASGRGGVAILRGTEPVHRLRPEHLFLASEIFPARLYLAPPPACRAAELSPAWAAERGVGVVLRDCDT